MKHLLKLASGALLASVLILSSCQDNQSAKRIAEERNEDKLDTRAAERDAQLVVDVVAMEYAGLELADAAQQKSNNDEVKKIAATLQDDQERLVNQLKSYAMNNNISVPDSATAEAQEDARQMADNNNAREFNEKWCNELLDQKEKTIKKLENAEQEVSDPALKTWISDALPILRKQRDQLMECKSKVKEG